MAVAIFDINDVMEANSRSPQKFFFSPATMRFFRSRVLPTVYGGRYFVTSEQFNALAPRLYTVRECAPDGTINTVGEFQAYPTAKAAQAAAKALAREEG